MILPWNDNCYFRWYFHRVLVLVQQSKKWQLLLYMLFPPCACAGAAVWEMTIVTLHVISIVCLCWCSSLRNDICYFTCYFHRVLVLVQQSKKWQLLLYMLFPSCACAGAAVWEMTIFTLHVISIVCLCWCSSLKNNNCYFRCYFLRVLVLVQQSKK